MATSPRTGGRPRLVGLDVLRGFALLGILQVNLQAFSFPIPAYVRPTLLGPLEGLDRAAWAFVHVVFELKYFSLFSLLFGAGLWLAVQGEASLRRFWARQLWLFVFGVAHGFLVWEGDVLMTYALAAPLVIGCRDWPVRRLVTVGAVVLLVPVLLLPAFEASIPLLPGWVQEGLRRGFEPSAADLARETALYRGAWWPQVVGRATFTLEEQVYSFVTTGLWRASGFMLVGMAVVKSGLAAGTRPDLERALRRWGFGLGVPFAVASAVVLLGRDFPPNAGLSLAVLNHLASLAVTLGLVGTGLAVARWRWRVVEWVRAAGRMSFTNYLSQSFLGATLFFGYGFGLYGQLARWQLVPLGLGIWLLQLAVSARVMRSFSYGPLEWLWRRLTAWTASAGAPTNRAQEDEETPLPARSR